MVPVNPLRRIGRSSTTWLGVLAFAAQQVLTKFGIPIPIEWVLTLIGAYGVKEAGANIGRAITLDKLADRSG